MNAIMEKMGEIQKMSDDLAKEMHIDIPKKRQSFEDFLQEKHMDDYHGTDDDAPDAYEMWCSNLDVQEVMDMAQEWGDTLI